MEPAVIVAIIGVAGVIITALAGYFGAKQGAKQELDQFAKEQKYQQLEKKRDYLRQWLIDNREEVSTMMMPNPQDEWFEDHSEYRPTKIPIDRPEYDQLQQRISEMRYHLLGDPVQGAATTLEIQVAFVWGARELAGQMTKKDREKVNQSTSQMLDRIKKETLPKLDQRLEDLNTELENFK